MKSPYKLSQELNITPQAVYKKIKQLNNELEPHLKKENGKILLTDEAEVILKNSFSEVQQPVQQTVVEPLNNQNDEFNNQFNNEIEHLREQNKLLQEQNKELQGELTVERSHNREITNKLIELTTNSQELTRNSQVLLKQEQDKNLMLLSDERHEQAEAASSDGGNDTEGTKKGIFAKIFKQKKR